MTLIDVDTAAYLRLTHPERIKKLLSIAVSDHCYRPRVEDLESDWVAHVAAPAFKVLRAKRGGAPIDSFCSIGTGSGLDVLTAVEILGAKRVGLTDVHQEVVETAKENISRNQAAGHPLIIEAGWGDLLEPLRPFAGRYDFIYENLPNVPLDNAEELSVERKSSTHVPPRTEPVPELIKTKMLDLHYLALVQAKDFLASGGAILSILGTRVPLQTFLALGHLAGYSSSFLTYTWKVQADPEEVIGDHAKKQKEGFGPFYFYRAEVLKKTFASVDITTSGQNALAIERSLFPARLDAASAYEAFKNGERIGHTVGVLKSELASL